MRYSTLDVVVYRLFCTGCDAGVCGLRSSTVGYPDVRHRQATAGRLDFRRRPELKDSHQAAQGGQERLPLDLYQSGRRTPEVCGLHHPPQGTQVHQLPAG